MLVGIDLQKEIFWSLFEWHKKLQYIWCTTLLFKRKCLFPWSHRPIVTLMFTQWNSFNSCDAINSFTKSVASWQIIALKTRHSYSTAHQRSQMLPTSPLATATTLLPIICSFTVFLTKLAPLILFGCNYFFLEVKELSTFQYKERIENTFNFWNRGIFKSYFG